jgi:alpha-N-arabinofuranosidase
MSWGGTPEPNTFGTHEFFNLAERLGAKTYLNVNLGTGTLEEAGDWLEYITSDSQSALAEERRRNGRAAPWKIDYLSIGNETWGCGGHMRPEYFADLHAQWATFLKTEGEQPVRIISGSHDGNIDYSDTVLDHPDIHNLGEGIALHYYTLPTSDWGDKGDSLGFPEAEWASAIVRTLRMDGLIVDQLAMIDRHERLSDDFKLYVDEWGVWTNTEEGDPALWQQNTIREAVIAALNFNIFHKHAQGVAMGNIAQMVNVLQAMILTEGADMVLTPTYHAFEMYKPFQGAEALNVSLASPAYEQGEMSFPALSASAARTDSGALVIAIVNADAQAAHDISLDIAEGATVTGRTLSGDALDAHNTIADKTRVAPKEAAFDVADGKLAANLPARSVSVFVVE